MPEERAFTQRSITALAVFIPLTQTLPRKPRSRINIYRVRRPRQRKASEHGPRSPLWSHWLPPERALWSRSPLQAEHRSPDKLRCFPSLLGELLSRGEGESTTFLPSWQLPGGMCGAERSADEGPPAAVTATPRMETMVSRPACKGNTKCGKTTARSPRLLGTAGRAPEEGERKTRRRPPAPSCEPPPGPRPRSSCLWRCGSHPRSRAGTAGPATPSCPRLRPVWTLTTIPPPAHGEGPSPASRGRPPLLPTPLQRFCSVGWNRTSLSIRIHS